MEGEELIYNIKLTNEKGGSDRHTHPEIGTPTIEAKGTVNFSFHNI